MDPLISSALAPPPAPATLSFVAAYVKAMDAELALLIPYMLFVYFRAMRRGFAKGPVGPKSEAGIIFSRRLMASINVGWLHNLVLYVAYADLYWYHNLSPELALFSHAVRVLLVTNLAWAVAMHIATGLLLDGRWKVAWVTGTAALIGLALIYATLEVSGLV